jgi:predicted DCC family thiol-disulfide oxidoreductase YuxK
MAESTATPEPSVAFSLEEGPVLLYDGECGVCNRSVQWILDHERKATLRFAPLQSGLGKRLTREAGVDEEIDSLLWVESQEGSVRARKWSGSVLATLNYVGGPWSALGILRVIPAPLRDFAYRLFARHRLKVAPQACLLPPPETRARFLDA